MKNRNIKAILFDMVGVLLFIKENYSPKTKDQTNAQKIENLYNHTDDLKLLGDINKELNLSKSELKNALECIPHKFERNEKLWKLLPQLKKNFDMAIINNGNALAMKYWNKRFDFSIFNFFINSAQVGIKKPDSKIYLLTCKKLNVMPNECLFMDDALENIQAAKDLGMTTVWWNRNDTKNENLRKFLELIDLK